MDSRELNKRVTIEQATQVKGASGGLTETWATVATVWAAVRNYSGNERRATTNGGQVAEARTEFRIHYRADVSAEMRILYNGAIYNIRHVNNLFESNRWVILTCDTGVNDG